MSDLYLMIGPPGAGKSTFIEKNLPNAHVVSPDHIVYDSSGTYQPSRLRKAWNASYITLLGLCQKRESPVVFDATLIRPELRTPLIQIGRFFGYTVHGVYVTTPVEECIKRNAARISKRPVPEHVIKRMAKGLIPPNTEEFDNLIKV